MFSHPWFVDIYHGFRRVQTEDINWISGVLLSLFLLQLNWLVFIGTCVCGKGREKRRE